MNKRQLVIIPIMAIFVTMVVLISLFGINIDVFGQTVLVESVEILNYDTIDDTTNTKVVFRNLIDYSIDDPTMYMIEWKVYPENPIPTNTKVEFYNDDAITGDETESDSIRIDQNGRVHFMQPGTYTVIVSSTDGSNKRDIIRFVTRKGSFEKISQPNK